MKFDKKLASIVLALASASSSAITIVVPTAVHTQSIVLDASNDTFKASFAPGYAGRSFLEILNFTVSGPSSLSASLTSMSMGGHNLDISSFGLYSGNTLLTAGSRLSTGIVESWSLDALSPAAGNYSMRVGGTVIGASNVSFVGTAYVSPVPEPETWSMLVAGLGIVGVFARRRRSSGKPSDSLAV